VSTDQPADVIGRALEEATMPDLPTDPAERLRLAAAGRREYAKGAPDAERAVLLSQANIYESAARIVTDDIALQLAIPSWAIDVPAVRPCGCVGEACGVQPDSELQALEQVGAGLEQADGFDRTAAHSEAAADRADSGTLREQIATWLADKFQSTPSAYQGKPKKLAAHAESLYAEVVAPIEAQRDQAAKNAMTCFEQAHDHLRAERDQIRADLTEARRERDEAWTEAGQRFTSVVHQCCEDVADLRWLHAEAAWQRDEARTEVERTARTLETWEDNIDLLAACTDEEHGGSSHVLDPHCETCQTLRLVVYTGIARSQVDAAPLADLPAEEWEQYHADVTGARGNSDDEHPLHHLTCGRCDVTAAYCPCDMPKLTPEGWREVREWNERLGLHVDTPGADSTGTGGQA
jgi:hypothetical protein